MDNYNKLKAAVSIGMPDMSAERRQKLVNKKWAACWTDGCLICHRLLVAWFIFRIVHFAQMFALSLFAAVRRGWMLRSGPDDVLITSATRTDRNHSFAASTSSSLLRRDVPPTLCPTTMTASSIPRFHGEHRLHL